MERKIRFVGRQRELELLSAEVGYATAGQPRVVLLTGEPGIGKTHTAQQVADAASAAGTLVLWGRCPEEAGAPPYWPWLQLIRRYLHQHEGPELAEVLGSAAPHLSSLLPDLASALGSVQGASADLDAAHGRFRLFDAIAGFWQRIATRQPLMLVIDDLHRADVPSLRLLEFLMAEAGSSRMLVLGTYRDADVSRQHPLSDTLAQLIRHAPMQRLLLGGFSPGDTAQFVAEATGNTSGELATLLHAHTEGHPLFLAELVHDYEQHWPQSKVGPMLVPKGVREVIGARLNRLTSETVDMLQDAAVVGRDFQLNLLCAVRDGVPVDRCLVALEEAQAASLITSAAEPGAYLFTHGLVRDTLYEELPAARRTAMHLRMGAALEAFYSDDLSPCLSALAHHFHAAGEVDKAIDYAARAARHATAMLAHEEAAEYYRQACALLKPGPATDARRCLLLLDRGAAQNSAGASASALEDFAQAAACARRLQDASLLARAAIGFGDAQWRLGSEGSEAVALIREALASGTETGAHQRAALLTTLCQALLFANQPDAAEQAFQEAVAIARRVDDPQLLFRALCANQHGRWFPDRLTQRIGAAREALDVARRAGHPEWASQYLPAWQTGDLMEFGDTAQATRTARLLLATAETKREPFAAAVALVALAMIATHEGRFDDAEALAQRASRCGGRFDVVNAAGIFGTQMFMLRRHQGGLAELAPVLRQFLDQASPGTTWQPGLAILHCELDNREEARKLFEALAAGDFAGLAQDAIRSASLALLAEVCVWLEDKERAVLLYDMLLPYAGRNIIFGGHTASLGAADRMLGMLATTLERWGVAQHHLEDAIAFDQSTGGRPWLVRSQYALAVLWLRRGRPGDAQPLLAAALHGARALGMKKLAQDLLADMSSQPDEAAVESMVAGLSKREIDVLRLVATGKTNREIAGVLFRSPNTVANHVRSILGKTQAANRAEAAAIAVRHGLLQPPSDPQ